MYAVLTGIVVFATLAMMVQHGIWNNLNSLIAIALGGVFAYGVHQPIVVAIDEATDGNYTYLLDFPILWFCFGIATGLIKEVANLLSKNRVNFPEKAEGTGGAGVGLLAGYLMACFTMSTFYAAALSENLMDGAYKHGGTVSVVQKKMGEAGVVTKPDFAWLSLMGTVLSPSSLGAAGFEPAIFVQQHTKHRASFEKLKTSIVNR